MKLNGTLIAGLMAATALATPALALEDGKLLVWINGDKGYDGLQDVGNRFAEELGVEVVVEHPESVTDKFQQAAANGEGPDIFIWPHDRYGEWAAAGLLSPLEPSDEVKANIIDLGWDATTVGGQIYGYPMAMEAVGLIYNKALVPTPPSTMEEIAAMQIDGVKANMMWDYNNTYFTMPLLAAGGGYAFKKVDGVYDPSMTGVANDGAVAGASLIADMIESGAMPKGVDYGVMDAAMNKGETAMVINGPWAWSNLEASGIDYGVAPIPSVAGQPSKPFVGVLGAVISSASPNKDLAVEFLENYVLTDEGLATINDNVPLGAVASKSFAAEVGSDPNIAATLVNAEAGVPMPSNPEMGKFWSAMEAALTSITTGQSTPEEALKAAEARILN